MAAWSCPPLLIWIRRSFCVSAGLGSATLSTPSLKVAWTWSGLTVNWFMIEIVNAAGTVTYRNSFITDLEVGPDTVVDLAACGRARWKIENESFNVLKNNGYNLEHNFGHGKANLSAVFVSLNLLAFAFHTVCDLADDLWRRAMEKMGAGSSKTCDPSPPS
jgi:hypothetical protein